MGLGKALLRFLPVAQRSAGRRARKVGVAWPMRKEAGASLPRTEGTLLVRLCMPPVPSTFARNTRAS